MDSTPRTGIAGSKGKCICRFANTVKLPSIETMPFCISRSNVCLFSPKSCHYVDWCSDGIKLSEKRLSPHPYRKAEKHNIYLYTFYLVCLFLYVCVCKHTHLYTLDFPPESCEKFWTHDTSPLKSSVFNLLRIRKILRLLRTQPSQIIRLLKTPYWEKQVFKALRFCLRSLLNNSIWIFTILKHNKKTWTQDRWEMLNCPVSKLWSSLSDFFIKLLHPEVAEHLSS